MSSKLSKGANELHHKMINKIKAIWCTFHSVVLPVFGDQPANAAKVAHNGFLVSLDFEILKGLQIAEN